jgi:hypothetical protein
VLSLVAIRRTNLRVADTWHFAAIFAGVCLPSARCGRRGLKSARYLAQSNCAPACVVKVSLGNKLTRKRRLKRTTIPFWHGALGARDNV